MLYRPNDWERVDPRESVIQQEFCKKGIYNGHRWRFPLLSQTCNLEERRPFHTLVYLGVSFCGHSNNVVADFVSVRSHLFHKCGKQVQEKFDFSIIQ